MKQIFVNLKRFDVPREKGGVCPSTEPIAWIRSVIAESVHLGMGCNAALQLTYLLPEGLVPAAVDARKQLPVFDTTMLRIGVQGVHWDDIVPGKAFGAFTTAIPATAARNLGATWAIIGHSEERRFKAQVMQAYDPAIAERDAFKSRSAEAVDRLVQSEVQAALRAGLDVLLCVGETAEQRGAGAFEEQKPRIEAVLRAQLITNLAGLTNVIGERAVVIGYEPVWAIGPGKTPPGADYIAFVSAFTKQVVQDAYGIDLAVVYGGGLKEENAAMIAGIQTIDGGLVALTQFTGQIGFDVYQLKGIVDKYLAQAV